MKEMDYDRLQREIDGLLEGQEYIVLSTSLKDRVTSRTVCYVHEGDKIYILTGKRSGKCKQIQENPHVALCVNNLQITGTASLAGAPAQEDRHAQVNELFKRKHSFYFERFAHFKAAVYIEIQCHQYKLWKFADGRDTYFCLDTVKRKAVSHT